MPSTTIDDDHLFEGLIEVFRLYGYEGASLTRISEATELQRSSLYHRFPTGKDEIVLAALSRADRIFEQILAPLAGPGDPAQRVAKMAKGLSKFYAEGRRSCLLDTLSLGGSNDAVYKHIKRSFGAWLKAMAAVAREASVPSAIARQRAEEALVRIEGSLVLSRATGDTRPFKRVLRSLPGLLTGR